MLILPLLSVVLLGYCVRDMMYEHKWEHLVDLSMFGKTDKLMPEYEKLCLYLGRNGYFLYNYAAELNYLDCPDESITMLEKCERKLNDYDIHMLLADNYSKKGEYEAEELHLYTAHCMCPNRFLPLYKMFLLFEKQGDDTRMKILAECILEKPIKISSLQVKQIKIEMQEFLNR